MAGPNDRKMTEMKALAHPVRMKMYALLRVEGRKTTGELAAALGIAVGSASYHVGCLRDAGLVVSANSKGQDQRQSFWAAREGSEPVGTAIEDSEEDGQAASVFRQEKDALYSDLYARYLDGIETLPSEWVRAEMTSDAVLSLTPKQLGELREDLEGVLRKWDAMGSTERDDAQESQVDGARAAQVDERRVVVIMRAFPWLA